MRRFWVFLFTSTAVLHIPFAFAAAEIARRAGLSRPTLSGLALALLLLAAFYGRLRLTSNDRPVPRWRRLFIEEPYYVHWCALVVTMPLFLVGVSLAMLSSLFVSPALVPSTGVLALGAYLIGFVLAAWGVFIRRRLVRVRTIDIPIRDLPPAFEGYRIAHLSDLHVGAMNPREHAESWVRTVEELGVDLVALTGDYVTSGVGFHRDIAELFASFKSRDGTLAVMGNHDYFGDGEGLVKLLRAHGTRVLRNERTVIERDSERLEIAGVDDTWSRRTNLRRAFEDRPKGPPLVVLAHDPQLFPELVKRGASLVLAGHTHWGQVALPFFPTRLNLSSRVYRFHADLYQDGDAWLYVSPGLGTTGPPVRLGAPPEITVLRLGALKTKA